MIGVAFALLAVGDREEHRHGRAAKGAREQGEGLVVAHHNNGPCPRRYTRDHVNAYLLSLIISIHPCVEKHTQAAKRTNDDRLFGFAHRPANRFDLGRDRRARSRTQEDVVPAPTHARTGGRAAAPAGAFGTSSCWWSQVADGARAPACSKSASPHCHAWATTSSRRCCNLARAQTQQHSLPSQHSPTRKPRRFLTTRSARPRRRQQQEQERQQQQQQQQQQQRHRQQQPHLVSSAPLRPGSRQRTSCAHVTAAAACSVEAWSRRAH